MSDSTSAIIAACRTRLLTFAPASGDTLQASLGGRLYREQAPDAVTYPYGVLRLVEIAGTDDSGLVKQAELELALYHRPRSTAPALSLIADVAEQALWQWMQPESPTQPLIKFTGHSRGVPVPVLGPDVDRDLVCLLRYYPLWYRPAYLHQYAAS